jgi:hypothetical protein
MSPVEVILHSFQIKSTIKMYQRKNVPAKEKMIIKFNLLSCTHACTFEVPDDHQKTSDEILEYIKTHPDINQVFIDSKYHPGTLYLVNTPVGNEVVFKTGITKAYSVLDDLTKKVDPGTNRDKYKSVVPRDLTLQEFKNLVCVLEDESCGQEERDSLFYLDDTLLSQLFRRKPVHHQKHRKGDIRYVNEYEIIIDQRLLLALDDEEQNGVKPFIEQMYNSPSVLDLFSKPFLHDMYKCTWHRNNSSNHKIVGLHTNERTSEPKYFLLSDYIYTELDPPPKHRPFPTLSEGVYSLSLHEFHTFLCVLNDHCPEQLFCLSKTYKKKDGDVTLVSYHKTYYKLAII